MYIHIYEWRGQTVSEGVNDPGRAVFIGHARPVYHQVHNVYNQVYDVYLVYHQVYNVYKRPCIRTTYRRPVYYHQIYNLYNEALAGEGRPRERGFA